MGLKNQHLKYIDIHPCHGFKEPALDHGFKEPAFEIYFYLLLSCFKEPAFEIYFYATVVDITHFTKQG